MNFSKLVLTGMATAILSTGAAVAEQVKIGIAAEPYPPFASPDSSGNWVGWEVEVADAICKAAELDCVITPVAWDGIIPSLTGQQIDAIMASMSITEERMKTIDFSNHYYKTPAVIVADKSSDIEPTPESLAGKIIGVNVSTIHQAYVYEHFKDAAEVRLYQTQDEANQDLVAGRVDAVQADIIVMTEFVNNDGEACCEIKGPVAKDESILGRGVGVGIRKGEDALLESFNAGIAAIIADGTHAEITSRYFTSSIYSE